MARPLSHFLTSWLVDFSDISLMSVFCSQFVSSTVNTIIECDQCRISESSKTSSASFHFLHLTEYQATNQQYNSTNNGDKSVDKNTRVVLLCLLGFEYAAVVIQQFQCNSICPTKTSLKLTRCVSCVILITDNIIKGVINVYCSIFYFYVYRLWRYFQNIF